MTFALTTLRFGLMTREDAGSGLAIAASTVPRSALASRLRPLCEALLDHVAQRDPDGRVARRAVGGHGDPVGQLLHDLVVPAEGESDVLARCAQGAAGGQRRVELELRLGHREAVAVARDVDRERPAERRVVALLQLHDRLVDGEAADVEVAGLGAGRDPLLLRGGGCGEGEEEERGEGGETDHGRVRVAAQAAPARGFARFARRVAGLSRKPSSSFHVVPAAARPVSTPRWPPGAVASSTLACGSSAST